MAETSNRGEWGSQLQFTLAVAGYVIGLGNIWRFPALAYNHGGGAFLVPYVTCSLLCGMPLLFLELCIGQYTQLGPSKAFYVFRPAFQGIGWAMACIANLTCIYYNVIVAWSMVYLFYILTGQNDSISVCANEWNRKSGQYCVSYIEDQKCLQTQNLTYYFNGTCHNETMKIYVESTPEYLNRTMSAVEQFFENHVLERSSGINEIGSFNWKVAVSLFIAWAITALTILYGVQFLGKMAYVTSTVPYVIMVAFFIRAITLEGSEIGIRYYLTEPQWEYVLKLDTWRAALNQICYSLGLGFGNLLSLASYNPIRHNCYRDAMLFAFIDTAMSVFGGTTVFATLGVLSQQQGKPISRVVQEGTSLAFIAYPETISRLPWPAFWSFCFFLTIFLIGVGSQCAMAEGVTTSFLDQFPTARKHRILIVIGVCLFDFLVGLIICTGAGIYWFTLFNNYSASFGLCIAILAEVYMILVSYGVRRWRDDMSAMFDKPRTIFGKIFGPVGSFMKINWMFISPLMLFLVSIMIIKSMFADDDVYGRDTFVHIFPYWSKIVGCILGILPALMLPIFFFYNVHYFKKLGKPFSELFEIQEGHPAFNRRKISKRNGSTQNGSNFVMNQVHPVEER
ncbi:unnamed protein product, partial [Mesorhabditis belari]|uniref:Transporter n=1 Tax=Mesorhabditis belari TaxID=2138241 RepID=A0AAF3EX81_9BILA